jgi:tRNA (adenine57-N1/adenine58-N1)-methyltransferase catalytic subunit
MKEDRWTEGEVGALKRAGHPALLVRILRGPQRIGDEGVLDLTDQLAAPVGASIAWSGAAYRLVRPSLSDLMGSIRRGAQIVTPKDAAQLLFLAEVGPGGRVAEAGAGSGAMTIALAHAVGPAGRVVTYDRRADFLGAARANLERAGLAERVTFRERDVASDGFDETGFSSIVLDLPEPWAVLPHARAALEMGGSVATFTPTYNQLERTVRAMRDLGFDGVRSVEILERALQVSDGGTRPAFEMLGHTGFLSAGRRIE